MSAEILELELQIVLSYLSWVLRTEFESLHFIYLFIYICLFISGSKS